MGGSIARGYYPGSGPTAEYNIAADIPASRLVFASGIPILMAPLDVTARLQLDAPNLQRLFAKLHSIDRARCTSCTLRGVNPLLRFTIPWRCHCCWIQVSARTGRSRYKSMTMG